MTTPLLEVRNLTKHFGLRKGLFGRVNAHVRAVDGVSFAVASGETLSLVGESGCGKSTTGKTVLKLLQPDSGSIMFEGVDITEFNAKRMAPVRRKLQIVFQDPYSSINPRMTAGSYVGEPLKIHGLCRGRDWQSRVERLFENVGLRPEHMRRYPHEFSGGQRQRLAIARALSLEPRLIVADEAVSALDVSIQASIINLLADLQQRFDFAYLFIAHDMGVVDHVSHRVAVMYLGKLVEVADRRTLFTAALHPYTQALLSAVPVPNPRLRRKRRTLLEGDVPSPIDPPPGCRFHTRCPLAEARCKVEEPVLSERAAGQLVACHLR
ncbi:MAG: ABC transporter ATP-binding protein [Gammaproteobacteria bacterium]